MSSQELKCAVTVINSMVQSLGPRTWIRTLHTRRGESRKEAGKEEPTHLYEIPKDCSRNKLDTPDLVLV